MSRCMLIYSSNGYAIAKRPMLIVRVDQPRVCSAELQRRDEAATRSFSRGICKGSPRDGELWSRPATGILLHILVHVNSFIHCRCKASHAACTGGPAPSLHA